MWKYNCLDELCHSGVRGMKWGVRKSPQKASNYSSQQRIRDRKIYGKGSEKRVNKRMLAGESVQSARHNEVVRKARIENGKTLAKRVAEGALVVGGAAAVTAILQKNGFGKSVASDVLTNEVLGVGRTVVNTIIRT